MKSQIQAPFVLLNISDIHYSATNKNVKEVFNNFIETVRLFISEHKEFTPNALVIVGDIASRGERDEYNGVKELIQKLTNTIKPGMEILVVPGNHDKNTTTQPKSTQHQEDANIMMDAFKRCAAIDKRISEAEKIRLLQPIELYHQLYFQPYSEFVHDHNKNLIPPFLQTTDHYNITGIRLVEQLKVCVVLLNTEWYYFPKENVMRKLTVGESIVQKLEAMAEMYKEEGYFVITLMHRSPYYLEWKEIFDEELKKSAFDRIVNMSDLIICGHEHNRQLKRPDFLLNKTQLFQNGSIYVNPQTHEGKDRYHYSASLLRIDPSKRLVSSLRFNLNTDQDNFTWRMPNLNEMETFLLDSISSPITSNTPVSSSLYPTISIIHPESTGEVENMCKRLFYSYDPDKPQNIDCPSNVKQVMVIDLDENIDSYLNEILPSREWPALYTHFIFYKRINYTLKNSKREESRMHALKQYEQIKQSIKRQHKDINTVSHLVFCKILFGAID